jgi:hypothetical protein
MKDSITPEIGTPLTKASPAVDIPIRFWAKKSYWWHPTEERLLSEPSLFLALLVSGRRTLNLLDSEAEKLKSTDYQRP